MRLLNFLFWDIKNFVYLCITNSDCYADIILEKRILLENEHTQIPTFAGNVVGNIIRTVKD